MYEAIKKFFEEEKVPKFRYKQIENAIFQNFLFNWDEIETLPKNLREKLKENFKIVSLQLQTQEKTGESVKFLFHTEDGYPVEAVLMLHKTGRQTVCVSSQVFCPLGCTFCATGANQYKRNLTKEEIIEQVLFVSRYLKDQKLAPVSNVVFMGMGEPFLNYEAVTEAIFVLNDRNKFDIGARHMTVSTSGIIPKIKAFADFSLQVRLAISLHAANNRLRSEIMPINVQYPLKELMKACDDYVEKKNKRISYEYVLISGINDSEAHARELSELLRERLAHVNVLIYNPHKFSDYKRPNRVTVDKFLKILEKNNINFSLRKSMGDEIKGACGQLAGE